jgi:hypothetical protein
LAMTVSEPIADIAMRPLDFQHTLKLTDRQNAWVG